MANRKTDDVSNLYFILTPQQSSVKSHRKQELGWVTVERRQMEGPEMSSSTPTATIKTSNNNDLKPQKPLFRPAQDDTKPPLKDPVSNPSLSIACAHTENHRSGHAGTFFYGYGNTFCFGFF
jgi:hypothetical protein